VQSNRTDKKKAWNKFLEHRRTVVGTGTDITNINEKEINPLATENSKTMHRLRELFYIMHVELTLLNVEYFYRSVELWQDNYKNIYETGEWRERQEK
jgi:hypothetical protein